MTRTIRVCHNIAFDRDGGHVLIIADDNRAYFAVPRIAAALRQANARELADLLGCAVLVDHFKQCCLGFRVPPLATDPREPSVFDAPQSDESKESREFREHIERKGTSSADVNAGRGVHPAKPLPLTLPEPQPVPEPTVIERYGLAIRIDDAGGHCWAFALDAHGKPVAHGVPVTRPSPGLVAEINRVLGTDYTTRSSIFSDPYSDKLPF